MIESICNELQMDIPKKERWINGGDIKCSYDFTHKEKRKIIEFNGDYWHANPTIYESSWVNPTTKKTALELWDYDKNMIAKNRGYNILVVWESDYIKYKKRIIDKCMRFLNES